MSVIASHLLGQIAGPQSPEASCGCAVFDAMERYAWRETCGSSRTAASMTLLAGDGPIDRSVVDSDSELARMLFGKSRRPDRCCHWKRRNRTDPARFGRRRWQ